MDNEPVKVLLVNVDLSVVTYEVGYASASNSGRAKLHMKISGDNSGKIGRLVKVKD
jgi:hypothetical protein